LTFIGKYYTKEYIIPYYLGESFSSMIPSIAGLIQGIGKDEGCRNVPMNMSDNHIGFILEKIPLEPLFSVSIFYIFLMVVLIICSISFFIINFWSVSLELRKNKVENSTELQINNEKLDSMQSITTNSSNKNIVFQKTSIEIPIKRPSIKEKYFLLILIIFVTFIGTEKVLLVLNILYY
jgi:hypothetical protein